MYNTKNWILFLLATVHNVQAVVVRHFFSTFVLYVVEWNCLLKSYECDLNIFGSAERTIQDWITQLCTLHCICIVVRWVNAADDRFPMLTFFYLLWLLSNWKTKIKHVKRYSNSLFRFFFWFLFIRVERTYRNLFFQFFRNEHKTIVSDTFILNNIITTRYSNSYHYCSLYLLKFWNKCTILIDFEILSEYRWCFGCYRESTLLF